MTKTFTPDVKLDPSLLAESIPLRRAGTEEVRVGRFSAEEQRLLCML